MSHDAGAACGCVGYHSPRPQELHIHHIWPLSWGGSDDHENRVWLCPTAHVNVHELLRLYRHYQSHPPWMDRKHFSPFVRALAAQGWERETAQGGT